MSTCDASTMLCQLMDLDPLLALLLIDDHQAVVGTHGNLCGEETSQHDIFHSLEMSI